MISQAGERYTKDLWSEREEGASPQLITCYDEHEQVEFIVARIHEHQRPGIPLPQQAVIFRSAQLSILLEAELTRQNIAYVKYGGLKFVKSAHVKDLMSFLRLVENPRDGEDRDRLLLSTMHSSKGLEWKVVYILHASDGRISHQRSMSDSEQLEEERRVFYVAMTRAADWLYVCHPRRQRASQYGGGYFDDYEQTELTGFITKSAKRQFDQQHASSFQPPAAAGTVKTTKTKRPRKKKTASKATGS